MKYRIGIVGSEESKFTPRTEALARAKLREIIAHASTVISGGCHLGGVDIWATQEARAAHVPVVEHLPARRTWTGGYKERNLLIARDCDVLVCITVRSLPDSYQGMRFDRGCYHCGTPPEHHVKSGGCWTMKQAASLGKRTRLIIIE